MIGKTSRCSKSTFISTWSLHAAATASESAFSLPVIPMWLGIHTNVIFPVIVDMICTISYIRLGLVWLFSVCSDFKLLSESLKMAEEGEESYVRIY